jgi:hypothetical protein
MADNIIEEGAATLPVSVSANIDANFAQVGDQLDVIARLQREIREDVQVYANVLNQVADSMQPLAQMSADDVRHQRDLITAKQLLLELSDKQTANARAYREETEKLLEVTQALSRIGGERVNLAIPTIPDVLERDGVREFRNIATELPEALADLPGPESAGVIRDVGQAMQGLEQGDLNKGIGNIHEALIKLNGINVEQTDTQRQVVDRLERLLALLQAQAVDGVPTVSGRGEPGSGPEPQSRRARARARAGAPPEDGPDTPDVPSPGEPGEGPPTPKAPQSLRSRLESLRPDLFGSQATEKSTEKLTGMVTDILPGGAQGGLGKIAGEFLPSGLTSIGSKVVPAAAIASTAKIAYDQYIQAEEQRRARVGIAGEMGMGESVGYDMQARVMALSPFMDNQKAREIISGSLREGYRGETADNAIDFVTDNFKRFNMETGQSLRIFSTNVEEAGASTEVVAGQLSSLSKEAANTNASVEVLVKNFENTSKTLVGLGAGAAAAPVAGAVATLFSGSRELKKLDPGQFLASSAIRNQMAEKLGVSYAELPGRLHDLESQPGVINEAFIAAIQEPLLRAGYAMKDPSQSAKEFEDELWDGDNPTRILGVLQAWGAPVTTHDQAVALAVLALNPKLQQEQAQKEVDKFATRKTGFFERVGARVGGVKSLKSLLPVPFQAPVAAVTGALRGTEGRRLDAVKGNYEENVKGDHGETMPLVEDWLKSSGLNVGEVAIREKGASRTTAMPITDYIKKHGYEGWKRLEAGELEIAKADKGFGGDGKLDEKHEAGKFRSLAEVTGHAGLDLARQSVGGKQEIAHKFELSADAKRILDILDLDENDGLTNRIIEEDRRRGGKDSKDKR